MKRKTAQVFSRIVHELDSNIIYLSGMSAETVLNVG